MICQECNERPATLHFTKIVNGEKTVVNLCEKCAQEKGEMFLLEGGQGFSINNLLAGLFAIDQASHQQKHHPLQQEILQCENCKMTFQQFVDMGMFGCAHCYETFRDQLKPIVKRVHSGNDSHKGKVPKRIGGSIHVRKQIQQLKEELQLLIAQEEFELAAEKRDEIRSLESSLPRKGEEQK